MGARPIADIVAGLRAKMEGVPAGPWTRASYGVDLCPPNKCGPDYLEVRADGDADIRIAIGAYIAACDPDTIRAVLDAHDAMRNALVHARDMIGKECADGKYTATYVEIIDALALTDGQP